MFFLVGLVIIVVLFCWLVSGGGTVWNSLAPKDDPSTYWICTWCRWYNDEDPNHTSSCVSCGHPHSHGVK